MGVVSGQIEALLDGLLRPNLFCSLALIEHLQRAVAPRGESRRMAAAVRVQHICHRLMMPCRKTGSDKPK